MSDYFKSSLDDIQIVLDMLNGKSITRITQDTGVSSVKINAAINRVEKDLECVLFNRVKGRPFIATGAALKAKGDLEAMVRYYEKAKHTLAEQEEIVLRMPVMHMLAFSRTVKDAEAYGVFKGMHFAGVTCENDKVEDSLVEGNLDLALVVHVGKKDPRLEYYQLFSDRLCAIVEKENPLAKQDAVTIGDLGNSLVYVSDYPVFLESEKELYKKVKEVSRAVYIDMKDITYMASYYSNKILTYKVYEEYLPVSHCMIPVKGLKQRKIFMVTAKDSPGNTGLNRIKTWLQKRDNNQ